MGYESYEYAREAGAKLSVDPYRSLSYEDDEDWEEEEDEEEERSLARRPVVWCTVGALAGLGVFLLLFVRSFGSGQDDTPRMIPPEAAPKPVILPMPTTQVVTQPPVVHPQIAVLPPTTTTRNPLLPAENRHDGNICDDNEELYAGLCYRRCSIMTQNTHPIRTSSWTCCQREPCTLGNTKGVVGKVMVCDGYDVSGQGTCPHEPGACLTNEELFLGVCYEKCTELTQGKFPHRIAAATCCQSPTLLGCLDVRKDKTAAEFNIGGGVGDHDEATPNFAHAPITKFTEAADTASTSYMPPTIAPGAGGHAPGDVSCHPDEELYAGLCYQKCSLLTQGQYGIRTSSWTCCANHPCGLSNQKGSIGHTILCNGYDVGGSGALQLGSSLPCPHQPLACKADEEMLLGVCYTTCSKLTDSQFPFRTSADTCCQEKSLKACLDIRKVATSTNFAVGTV